jgi:cysteine desulfurase
MGVETIRAIGAVRLSVGWTTTEGDINRAAAALIAAWRHLVKQ